MLGLFCFSYVCVCACVYRCAGMCLCVCARARLYQMLILGVISQALFILFLR